MGAPYVGLKEHSKNVFKIKSQMFIFRVYILGFFSFASSLKKFKVRKAERLKIRSNNRLSFGHHTSAPVSLGHIFRCAVELHELMSQKFLH